VCVCLQSAEHLVATHTVHVFLSSTQFFDVINPANQKLVSRVPLATVGHDHESILVCASCPRNITWLVVAVTYTRTRRLTSYNKQSKQLQVSHLFDIFLFPHTYIRYNMILQHSLWQKANIRKPPPQLHTCMHMHVNTCTCIYMHAHACYQYSDRHAYTHWKLMRVLSPCFSLLSCRSVPDMEGRDALRKTACHV
jgi:hypothetical protein